MYVSLFYYKRQGIPFVGAAGKLLSEMLEQVGLKREDVYITNIIKCRAPNNRDPEPEEVKACWPYLEKQIEFINPKVICFLGRHAMHRFFPSFQISKVHGKCFRRPDGRVYMPLYHPAAALYNGGLRDTLFSDFRKIPKVLEKMEELPKVAEVPKEQKLF